MQEKTIILELKDLFLNQTKKLAVPAKTCDL